LDGNHLSPLFKAIATGKTTRFTKPFPDPILWAARLLGVSPKTCLMVGDTTPDIRAGRAAGAQTLGVLCGFGDELELRAAGADDILASTANLPALFNLYAPSE
jgi:phosphoglycolate phosphatase-like HAD superfamily hydrolase